MPYSVKYLFKSAGSSVDLTIELILFTKDWKTGGGNPARSIALACARVNLASTETVGLSAGCAGGAIIGLSYCG